jgi:hypothetical protein
VGPVLRELLRFLVVRVVAQHPLQLPNQVHERRRRGVGVLHPLRELDDLGVLLLVVRDLLRAVRHVLLDRRVDVHLLGDRVTHHLRDHRVGEIAAPRRIRRVLDLAEQLHHLPVVGGEDVDDVRG